MEPDLGGPPQVIHELVLCIFINVFETETHHLAWAGLCLPFECWGHKHEPPQMAHAHVSCKL